MKCVFQCSLLRKNCLF